MGTYPDEFEFNQSAGRYMKFQEGDNRFRVLGDAIGGWEYWVPNGDKKKPVRRIFEATDKSGSKILLEARKNNAIPDQSGNLIKQFIMVPVWNYTASIVQILEITQKTIGNEMRRYDNDPEWGPNTGYDLVVSKTKSANGTKYDLAPKPAKEIDADIAAAWEEVKKGGFNLKAVFDKNGLGGDVFGTEIVIPEGKRHSDDPGPSEEEVNIDDVPLPF